VTDDVLIGDYGVDDADETVVEGSTTASMDETIQMMTMMIPTTTTTNIGSVTFYFFSFSSLTLMLIFLL
jgi:hypothetical protein